MRLVAIRYIASALLLTFPTLSLAQTRSRAASGPVPDQGIDGRRRRGWVCRLRRRRPHADPDRRWVFEYYLTPRLSLRPSVMFLDAGFDDESEDSLRQTRLGVRRHLQLGTRQVASLRRRWLGVHALRLKDNGHAFGDTENRARR